MNLPNGLPDPFADARSRAAELRRRLAGQPVAVVHGVVSAFGVSAGRSGSDAPWTCTFSLDAWRVDGGALIEDVLKIVWEDEKGAIGLLHAVVAPYATLKIRAHLGPDVAPPTALLQGIVGIDDSDVQLNRFAAERQVPVVFHDEILGDLVLDRSVDLYTGEVAWNDSVVALHLPSAARGIAMEAVARARTVVGAQSAWDRRAREVAASELLALKNETWLEEDEGACSAMDFIARLSMTTIDFDGDGAISFWLDDGDLFWGHAILVRGDLDVGLLTADLAG
jgi:hypothetical protein